MKPVAWRYENKNVKGNWYITWTEPPDGFNKRPLYESQDANRIEELERELQQARFSNAVTYGCSHPEMYKSELDLCKEKCAALLADNERLQAANDDWRYASGPDGWITALRTKCDALLAHNERLRDAGKRASVSLGAFTSDEGWSEEDMNNMDYLDAILAATEH